MVASSDVISSNPSNLERVRGSTVGGVEPAVRDRMSSTFFVKKLWNATAARGQEFSWLLLVRIEFKIFHCSLELSSFSSIFRRVNSACFCWRSCLCISNADFQLSRVSGVFSRRHNRSNRRIVRFDLLQSVSYHLATRPTRQRKLRTGACLSARASSTVSYKSKSWTGSSLVVEYNSEFIRSSLNLIGSIFFQGRFETNWDLACVTAVWNEKETIEWSEIDGGCTVMLQIFISSRMMITSRVWPRLCVGTCTALITANLAEPIDFKHCLEASTIVFGRYVYNAIDCSG